MLGPLAVGLAEAHIARGVATLRFQHPYSEAAGLARLAIGRSPPNLCWPMPSARALGRANDLAGVRRFSSGAIRSAAIPPHERSPIRRFRQTRSSRSHFRARVPRRDLQSFFLRTEWPLLAVQGAEGRLGTGSEIENGVWPFHPRAQVRWVAGASPGFPASGPKRAGVFDDLSDQIADPVNTRERGGAGSRSLRRGSGAIVLCASLGFGHVGLATEGHRAAHHLPGMGRERHGDGNVGMSALSVRLTLPLLAALLRGLSSRPGNLSLCASVGPGAIRSAGSPGRGSS